MRISDIQNVGAEVLKLRGRYHNPPRKEMFTDAILFAYMSGRFSQVDRQHYVYPYGSVKPKRIDFRFGGSNPVFLELAVRQPTGGGQLLGSQNATELMKLCRVTHTQARLRILLLLDLYHEPLKKRLLKASYDPICAGPGNFKRTSVRVIYVHARRTFHFRWSPFRS